MVDSYSLPNRQKLSVLIATIMLAFAIARFVQLPGLPLSVEILGIFISIEININTFIAIIVAGLTASGVDWLLRDHPRLGDHSTVKHWVLPALTTWVISFPLSFLPTNASWWAAFIVAAVVILMVIVAEYVAADSDDFRQPIASIGLIALSFMLFLIFVVSLRSVGLRLIFILPAIGLSTGLVSLRVINLRFPSAWLYPQTLSIVLIVTQLAAALHYLRISPITFGIILLGLAYSLINFVSRHAQAILIKIALLESLYILAIFWLLAFFLP